MARIYLDNSATTPLDPDVLDTMTQAMRELHGNPSSIHAEGRRSRTAVEQARKAVARHLNASIGEIFFTSGGTEANNMSLKNAVRDLGVERIISSPLEHHCVLHSLEAIEQAGQAEVVQVRVDSKGCPDLAHLAELLADTTRRTMVSLMHANNEIGTMIDLEAVAALCHEHGVLFHCDTVQTIGYYPIDVSRTPISFLSGSAHKFYGPKGAGFIYINSNNLIKPYLDGGSQERNMRGGTENLHGIIGLARALDLQLAALEERARRIREVRDYFRSLLEAHIPGIEFNGDPDNGHYKVLSAAFPPSDKGDLLLLSLDIAGISASGGSACSSGVDAGSHVINHLHPGSQQKTIRFSFSHLNTKEEADTVVAKLKEILEVSEQVKRMVH